MVSNVVYKKATYKQIGDIEYAIGFDNREVHGTRHRRYEPYRNYFDAGSRDSENWEQLVPTELATRSGEYWYHVPDGRCLFLERMTDVEILPESD